MIISKRIYAYSRIKARRGRLLTAKVDELKRKKYSDLIVFLQRVGYIKDIKPSDFDKIEIIEVSIRRNLLEEYELLKKILPKDVKDFLSLFQDKIEIYNIKNFLRLKLTKNLRLVKFFIPSKSLPNKILSEIRYYSSVDGAISSLEKCFKDSEYYEKVQGDIKNFKDLMEKESILDSEYLLKFSKIRGYEKLCKYLIDKINIVSKFVFENPIFLKGGFLSKRDLPRKIPWNADPALSYYPFLSEVKDLFELDDRFDDFIFKKACGGIAKCWYSKTPFMSYILMKEYENGLIIRMVIEKYYQRIKNGRSYRS